MPTTSTLSEDVLKAALTGIERIIEAVALHAEAEQHENTPLLSQPASGDAQDQQCAPKPLPASWPLPNEASFAGLKSVVMSQAPVPAEDGMCTFPLLCSWKVDYKHGVAYWGCDEKAPQPRGWLNLCPEGRSIFFLLVITFTFMPLYLVFCLTMVKYRSEYGINKENLVLSGRPASDQPDLAGNKVD